MIDEEEVNDFLEHFGVKGMRWGVRKKEESSGEESSQKKKNTKRNVAIIIGSAVGVAAVTAGVIYAKKHMNVSMSDISKPTEAVKKFADSMASEPVGIVHAARGKSAGWTFPGHGGLSDPVKEHLRAGFAEKGGLNRFWRYGDRNEKIAARLLDPEGRKDWTGRDIFHELMLPESLAKQIQKFEDINEKVWPMIKDKYQAIYDA